MAKKKPDEKADETPQSEPTTPSTVVWGFTAEEWSLIEGALLRSPAFGARATEEQASLLQKVREAKAKA